MSSDNIFGWPNGTVGQGLEDEFIREVKKLCGSGLTYQRMLQILTSMFAKRSHNDYVHAMRLADNTCDCYQLTTQQVKDLSEKEQVFLESCGKTITLSVIHGGQDAVHSTDD